MTAPTLIFAWGNPSRGDDALGPLFGEHFATLAARHPEWGKIEFQTDFQLQVEHALDLHGRVRILFVDASIESPTPFRLQRIDAAKDASFTSHAMSPQAILQVYVDIEDAEPPPAWLLSIHGEAFELGEPLSNAARINLEAALAAAAAWISEANSSLQDAHARWQAQRMAELQHADSWLSLIGLFWLDDGTHVIGTNAACDVQLPAGPDRLGEVIVSGNQAEWKTADTPRRAWVSDAGGDPEVIRCGDLSFYLIERDGRLALRLRDAQAPARLNFSGIPCYGVNPEWCIEARWDGHQAHFSWQDVDYTLTPQNPQAEPLHFVLADATSGHETYGGGRFLHASPSGEHLVLDFNRAINPPCAFSAFAVCPLPPPENRLPFPITAGEMRYTASQ